MERAVEIVMTMPLGELSEFPAAIAARDRKTGEYLTNRFHEVMETER